MRNLFRWWLVVGAVLGAAMSAHAQSPSSYPDRPIRLVVAFPPGGATDTLAHQITQELGEALGQQVPQGMLKYRTAVVSPGERQCGAGSGPSDERSHVTGGPQSRMRGRPLHNRPGWAGHQQEENTVALG